MATTAVWKGLIRFGLLSMPVKLYRAAQAEKISFRQVHKATGARVRHRRCAELPGNEAEQSVAAAGWTGVVEPLPTGHHSIGHRHP